MLATGLAVLGVAAYCSVFAWVMARGTYGQWAPMLVFPALLVITVPLLCRHARRDPLPWLRDLLVLAAVAKLVAALPGAYVAVGLYGGKADAARYFENGNMLAASWRASDFSLAPLAPGPLPGTKFVDVVTGVVSYVVGPSLIAQYLVFSWIGFWGLYHFHRAFRIAFPDGDARQYALVVFFLPSMLLWPSAIGKEALMIFALGLCGHGGALLLAGRRGAIARLAPGIAAALMVRPHIALLVFLPIVLAYLLRGRSERLGVAARLRSGAVVVVMLGATVFLAGQVEEFLGIDDLSLGSATSALTDVQRQTTRGASQYVDGDGAPSLVNLPMAVITVLFRPFPHEAHNLQSLLVAVEGAGILALVVLRRRTLLAVPRRARQRPYIIFCTAYALAFCFFFSSFQNFGILTRERVQVLPFVLALLFFQPGRRRTVAPSGQRPGVPVRRMSRAPAGDPSPTGG